MAKIAYGSEWKRSEKSDSDASLRALKSKKAKCEIFPIAIKHALCTAKLAFFSDKP